MDMYGDVIIESIRKAQNVDEKKLPKYPKKRSPKLKAGEQERIRRLKEWRENKTKRLKIEPALILNKSQISSIAAKNPKTVAECKSINEMKNWQMKEFGAEIVSIIKT